VSAREPRYPLSLSVSVVRITPRTTRSIAELMLQVDRAMYQKSKETNEGLAAKIQLRIGE
jgi:hypothetical protein